MDILQTAYVKSTWNKTNTSTLTLKDLKSVARFSKWSLTNISGPALAALYAHYGVDTPEEALKALTVNDRQAFEELTVAKSRGDTDHFDQITERAWVAKGQVVNEPVRIVVTVESQETIYKEDVFPVPEKVRPGIAQLVNATCCMVYVDGGHIKPMPRGDSFEAVFKHTPMKIAKMTSYVEQLSTLWDKAEHVLLDRMKGSTFRGLDCASVMFRFFSGITISQYIALHDYVVTTVLDLYVTKRDFPTEELKTVHNGKDVVPLVPKGSVAQLTEKNVGEWGVMAASVKEAYRHYPKVLTGPVPMDVRWFDAKDVSTSTVRAAVIGAQNVRGGEKSYWSKMMNCLGFSVVTEHINNMRILVALASGVLMADKKSVVQIEVKTCEIDVVDHSLQQRFDKERILYIVDKETRVKMARHPLVGRVSSVPDNDAVYVAINNMSVPALKKNQEASTVFAEAMAAYLEVLEHDQVCVWTPILDGCAIDAGPKEESRFFAVTIRPPYDMYAVMTTNPDYVHEKFFPKKKVMENFAVLSADIIRATSDSFAQIFQPVRLRSTSMDLLNILHFPIDTAVVVINKNSGNFECAAYDDGTFEDEDAFDEEDIGPPRVPDKGGDEKEGVGAGGGGNPFSAADINNEDLL
jgi:hypothetical protein